MEGLRVPSWSAKFVSPLSEKEKKKKKNPAYSKEGGEKKSEWKWTLIFPSQWAACVTGCMSACGVHVQVRPRKEKLETLLSRRRYFPAVRARWYITSSLALIDVVMEWWTPI